MVLLGQMGSKEVFFLKRRFSKSSIFDICIMSNMGYKVNMIYFQGVSDPKFHCMYIILVLIW